MTQKGFELKTVEGKGEGIFATKSFIPGEVVMRGEIEQVLDANHSHASQINRDTHVLHAGMVPKVNHCCSPNCGIKVNETGAHNFVAMSEISPGEEITFDYAMRNYSIEYFPEKCLCGASDCRGSVTGWKGLSETKKAAYKGFAAPYLYELDAEAVQLQSV